MMVERPDVRRRGPRPLVVSVDLGDGTAAIVDPPRFPTAAAQAAAARGLVAALDDRHALPRRLRDRQPGAGAPTTASRSSRPRRRGWRHRTARSHDEDVSRWPPA